MLFDPLQKQYSFPSLLALCLASFIAYYVLWIIYARTLHPLSKIPGPFLASVSRLWIVMYTMQGNIDVVQRQMHQKYGTLIRIAPNEVACSDPNAIKRIYRTQGPLMKTDFYPIWGNKTFSKYPDNFSGTDEKLHSERRRIVNSVYALSNVLQSEKYIDKCSQLFLEKLGDYADKGQTIHLCEWLQWYAFDVIGELYFGRMFGFMENSHDHEGYISSLDTLLPALVTMAVSASYVRPLMQVSAAFSPAARRAFKAIDHVANAARSCVAYRQENPSTTKEGEQRRDLLQQLLEIVREKGEKVDFGIHEVEYEAYVAIFAGSDTTAIAMRATLYFLMKNTAVYRQLQQEFDDAAQNGQLSFPISYAEAIKLPLLCASIKEAMRLHPSVGLTMPRIIPKGGMELDGQHLAAGYRVGMNAAVLQYNKEIFGEDADQFRPSRWINGNATNMEKHLLIFGAGTRTCIGKNISLSEIHKLIPQILWNFDLELVEPERPWHTLNHWFHKQSNIQVRLRRRHHNR